MRKTYNTPTIIEWPPRRPPPWFHETPLLTCLTWAENHLPPGWKIGIRKMRADTCCGEYGRPDPRDPPWCPVTMPEGSRFKGPRWAGCPKSPEYTFRHEADRSDWWKLATRIANDNPELHQRRMEGFQRALDAASLAGMPAKIRKRFLRALTSKKHRGMPWWSTGDLPDHDWARELSKAWWKDEETQLAEREWRAIYEPASSALLRGKGRGKRPGHRGRPRAVPGPVLRWWRCELQRAEWIKGSTTRRKSWLMEIGPAEMAACAATGLPEDPSMLGDALRPARRDWNRPPDRKTTPR